MPKQGEHNYLMLTGEAGRQHNLGKPFSDNYCGMNLAAIGTVISLLPPPPTRILDMGCGGGWTSIFFAKCGYEVVGLDISKDMIELARQNQANQQVDARLSFKCKDFEGADFENEFDAVVFYDCLHHAEDEQAAIASAYRALKTGGILIAHEPGEGHSTAPGSIEAMRLYGVTERDMPPDLIIRHGQALGFSDFRIFPIPHELLKIFYHRSIPPLLSKEAFLLAKRVLRNVFRPSKRASSIVILTK